MNGEKQNFNIFPPHPSTAIISANNKPHIKNFFIKIFQGEKNEKTAGKRAYASKNRKK
jgi:hypothetical protein